MILDQTMAPLFGCAQMNLNSWSQSNTAKFTLAGHIVDMPCDACLCFLDMLLSSQQYLQSSSLLFSSNKTSTKQIGSGIGLAAPRMCIGGIRAR